jgi:thiol:disulfide interchange protein DsbD
VTLPWLPALAILLTLGLGLAAPFLLVSAVPFLARRLPRPGAWMDTLKQLLAFPMFATAAWLIWVLSVQTGPTGVALVLTGLLMLSFGLWLRERTALGSDRRRLAGGAAALAALAVALWLAVLTAQSVPVAPSAAGRGTHTSGLVSEPYTPEQLAAARAQGRPVFVNMTAAWCITCLVNERVALDTAAVAAAFARGQVRYLKGDWTNRDAAITDYLAGFGRNGVPLYVFYPPGEPPRVLSQVLTPAGVIAALAPTIPPNQSQPEE